MRRPVPRLPGRIAGVTGVLAVLVARGDWLEDVERNLQWQSSEGRWRADLGGMVQLEAYAGEAPLPGLVFNDDGFFLQPRLTLTPEVAFGRQWSAFARIQADRGFDPGSDPEGDLRADEYGMRYTPWEDGRLSLQAGKFASLFGNWIPGHGLWDDPFITAPAVYETITVASDVTLVPGSAALLARRQLPDNKSAWVPLIWGPSETAGLSASGHSGRWDYGIEVKNNGLASRPGRWDPVTVGWEDPTVTARLGWRPSVSWALGASFSRGAWLRDDARPAVAPISPVPLDPGDWPQTVWGVDASYAWHRWEFRGEAIGSRFEMPGVGDTDAFAYYVQGKYRFGTGLYAALRWNQEFFSEIEAPGGGETGWDRDLWRMDFALGWNLSRSAQIKGQFSYGDTEGENPQGRSLGVLQFTLKF